MKRNLRQKQKGSIYAFSLLIMMILLVTAMSISFISVTEMKSSSDTRDSSMAFQVADSSAEKFLQVKEDNPSYTLGEIGDVLGVTKIINPMSGVADTIGGEYEIRFYDDLGNEIWDDATPVSEVKRIKVSGKYKTLNRAIEMSLNAGLDSIARIVSAGYHHSCVLTEADTVVCWGGEDADEGGSNRDFGQNDNYNEKTVAFLETGRFHNCIIRFDNSVECWGMNSAGQANKDQTLVGIDELVEYSGADYTPPAGKAITQMELGDFHTCFLLDDGTVDCIGCEGDTCLNEAGQKYNDNHQSHDYISTHVSTFGAAVKLSAGKYHTCVIASDGSDADGGNVVCWGQNSNYQANPGGSTGDLESPEYAYQGGDAIYLEASDGGNHTCILTSAATNNVKCWGRDNKCQVSNNDIDGDGSCATPYTDGADNIAEFTYTDAKKVLTGGYHTCVLTGTDSSDYDIKCWGEGDATGISGTDCNQTNVSDEYKQISTIDSFVIGGYHNCVLNTNNEVYCWGCNNDGTTDIYGQSNPKYGKNSSTPKYTIGLSNDWECDGNGGCITDPLAWPQ